MGDTSVEGIRGRMVVGLDGRDRTWLAGKTGDDYKGNVQRWLRKGQGDKNAPPVDFVARYCMALPLINPAWVLLGDPEPKYRSPPNGDGVSLSDELRALAERAEKEGR